MRVQALFRDQDVRIDGPDVDVTALTYDSRRVAPGALFAALPGQRADGHAHLGAAVARGAVAVLVERPIEALTQTRVVATSSRRALALAAKRWFGAPSDALTMIGVTGTNGKTTTVHLVAALLEAAGKRAGTIGTLGTSFAGVRRDTGLTTPESLDLVGILADMRDGGAGAVAMEVSSHALAQERVTGVDFDIAVFTNLTHDHLDYHGDLASYFTAKARLFRERLKPKGRAVVNIDDPHGRALAASLREPLTVGRHGEARVRLGAAALSGTGTTLRLEVEGRELVVRSPLVGGFNAENLALAAGVGVALGLPDDVIARGLGTLAAVPGRLERCSAPGEPLVLVDYAHTPDALAKALAAARGVTVGRLLCVFGCGGDRDPSKRGPMGAVAVRSADWTIITSDNPRGEDPKAIAAACVAGARGAGGVESPAPGPQAGFCLELDRAQAIRRAIAEATPHDTLLIAGKGHETYQIIGAERRHFDDRDEARRVLQERR